MVKKNRKIFYNLILLFVILLLCCFVKLDPACAQELGNAQLANFGQAAGYGQASLPQVIGQIVRIVLSLLGIAAVIIMVAGGFMWMSSGGSPEKVEKAKKIIVNGLIGLLIIIFAYAIATFVMEKLGLISGMEGGNGINCVAGECCAVGYRCSATGNCNVPETGCSFFSLDIFRIRKIETIHGGLEQNYHQDVYLCSAVQPIFNRSAKASSVQELAAAGELRIENVSGNWEVRNNVLIFKHPDIFSANTAYKAYFPKAIIDLQSKYLQQCLAAGGCSETSSHFIWNFTTGEQNDTIPPEMISSYPVHSPDNRYPDQNVSRAPLIEVNFSEPIDITTVADEDNYPLEQNIWIAVLDGQNGNIVQTLPKEFFEVYGSDNGFKLMLKNGNLLDSFVWYRIHVSGVEDLCLNAMIQAVEWEFQTNDSAPGIRSYYPANDKVCPDTDISVVFETSMYNSSVTMIISGGGDNFSFSMRPADFSSFDYKKIVNGGVFSVKDPGEPLSNHFKVFSFNPSDNLKEGTTYDVQIATDLVINQQGGLLSGEWNFKTTNLETCLCSPWITHLDPSQGVKGECLTLYGECFNGTSWQTAEPVRIEFILDGIFTESIVGGFGSNYLTTTVPDNYAKGDRPKIQTIIQYPGGEQINSNQPVFYVNDNTQADGPCLWSINPSAGYPGETRVDFSGLRFGAVNNSNQIFFFANQTASYSNWTEQNITGVLVPLNAQDGPVNVFNEKGASNSLSFDVLAHLNAPGGTCYQSYYCPDNPMYECGEPVYSCLNETGDTCRCCCNVSLNSCPEPLECTAGQGDCTGTERGLCCGCQNDVQCGAGFGCAMIDPSHCCYGRPKIVSYSPNGNNVCLNAAAEIIFNTSLDRDSFDGNISFKKIASLVASKAGRDYQSVENRHCTSESVVYTGSCVNNSWEYEFNFPTEGEYEIYAETSNYSGEVKDAGEDSKCSEPGIQHHVVVFVDGQEKGNFCADASLLHQFSRLSLSQITAGIHTIKLLWDNDWYQQGAGDSNIRIYQVGIIKPSGQEISFDLVSNNNYDKIILYPRDCTMDSESVYEIRLTGGVNGQGIRSDLGVSIDDYTWQFITGTEDNFCQINQIKIDPQEATVTSFSEDVVYIAQAYDAVNQQVCVAGFNWKSEDLNIAAISRDYGQETTVSPVSGSKEGSTVDISAEISSISGIGEFTSILNPPVINGIYPNQGSNNQSIPTYVTIIGREFGDKQGNSVVKFGETIAEIGCNNWSDAEIVTIVPASLAPNQIYSVRIVNAEQGMSNEIDFTVNNEFHPAICELQPNHGETGTKIKIKGINFGDQQESNYLIFGKGGSNLKITDFDKWSNKEIEMTVPEFSGEKADIEVWVASPTEQNHPFKPSNTVSFYKNPTITGISPDKGPKGTWITIRGSNFGSEPGTVYFQYNGQDYQADPLPNHCPKKWTNNEVIVAVPQALPAVTLDKEFYDIQIYLKTFKNINSNLFGWKVDKSSLPPMLCDIFPKDNLSRNDLISIKGKGFGSSPSEPDRNLFFNQDKKVISLRWPSDTEIRDIILPVGAIDGEVYVEKKIISNCRLTCDGLSFAGKCFGNMVEVCDQEKIKSNPLYVTVAESEETDLPQVVENSTCEKSFASPSPQSFSLEACSNTVISATFNQEVSGLTETNIIVRECNKSSGTLNEESCLTAVSGTVSLTDFDNQGFVFTPDDSLNRNYWYEVTLKSGITGIKNQSGGQLDGNKNGFEDGSADDYIWYFKTKDQEKACSATTVKIVEQISDGEKTGLIVLPGTRDYFALALSQDCQILRIDSFDWIWTSSKANVATASGLEPKNMARATGVGFGETEIKATATLKTAGEESSFGVINLIVAQAPSVSSYQPSGNNVCRNAVVSATFDQIMDEQTVSLETVKLFGAYKTEQKGLVCKKTLSESDDVYKFFARSWENFKKIFIQEAAAAKASGEGDIWQCELPINIEIQNIENKTIFNIKTEKLFDQGRKYIVVLDNGLKNQYGLNLVERQSWEFVADEICRLSEVIITPERVFFNKGDETKTLTTKTYDDYGNEIYGIPDVYDWIWSWTSSEPAFVSLANFNENLAQVKSNRRNGYSQISAIATPNIGDPVSDMIQAEVFICKNPWDYEDAQTNFRLKYCRDTEKEGNLLPLLSSPAVSTGGGENLLKEFLFSVSDTGDAIGLKVIKNDGRLSPAKWYQENVPNRGSPQNIVIDGYYALREGRTTYVGATDVSFGRLVYINNYIYLISYNDKASEETEEIFRQLLNNWRFNTNLDDLLKKGEIQRDLLRIYDIEEMKSTIEDYNQDNGLYPILRQGTYVQGKTNSLWSSWQNTLGQEVGVSMPVDPVNKFSGSCAGCSDGPDYQCQNTCYNSLTDVFEHPFGSHVYQYYVPEDEECQGFYYKLGINFEYSDRTILWGGQDEIRISISDQVGVANYYYSSEQAQVCNDGILQCGEFCDTNILTPPANTYCNATCTDWACSANWGNCDGNWSNGCEAKIIGSSCNVDTDCCSGNCLNNVCRSADWQCDDPLNQPCCANYHFASSSVVCRGQEGACDVAEKCTGNSATCPTNGYQVAGTLCRISAGTCDPPEYCSGDSVDCPSNFVYQNYHNVVCRPSAGACDVAEKCSGSVNCPSNTYQSNGTSCGICKYCQSGSCVNVSSSYGSNLDPNNQCDTADCYTGNCGNNTGVCAYYTSGQRNCNVCYSCNTGGICTAITGSGSKPYLGCGSGNCVNGVCCSLNHCSYDNRCYAPGVCHPAISQQKCSGGKWVSSCGDGNTNCGEVCDGQIDVPCGNCNLGLQDCVNCSWEPCKGGGACVPGATEVDASSCVCKICNTSCKWDSQSMCYVYRSVCAGCSSCGGCGADEACCYDRVNHIYYKGLCSTL